MFEEAFARLVLAHQAQPNVPFELRIERLTRLETTLTAHRNALITAVNQDFGGRSTIETKNYEIIPLFNAIKHAKTHLRSWMRPKSCQTPMLFSRASAEIRYEPLGVVGIRAPWNYPIFLALAPLIGALSAGNRIMLFPSEASPQTSKLLKTMLASVFGPDEVFVIDVNGDSDIALAQSKAFVELKFNHLIFTGSTAVGKKVMEASSQHLASVTLELGGKSPSIIGKHADFTLAVERIMYGKCINAGQTCVAPDYVWLPEGRTRDFIKAAQRWFKRAYPNPINGDYTSIINTKQLARLEGLIEDATAKGARVTPMHPGPIKIGQKLIPIIIENVSFDMRIMQEEIFGPVLPIMPYREKEDITKHLKPFSVDASTRLTENPLSQPLTVHCFSSNEAELEYFKSQIQSGSFNTNSTLIHVGVDTLPFGGIGKSGDGQYDGEAGFKRLSHAKSCFKQAKRSIPEKALMPPYGTMQKLTPEVMMRIDIEKIPFYFALLMLLMLSAAVTTHVLRGPSI